MSHRRSGATAWAGGALIAGGAGGATATTGAGATDGITAAMGAANRHLIVGCPQHHAVFLNLRLDPALNFALGNPVQHRCIRRRGLRAEIAVFRCQIPEVFGNRLHRVEGIVKTLEGT